MQDRPAEAMDRLRTAALAHPALAGMPGIRDRMASPDDVIEAVRILVGSRGSSRALDDIRLEVARDAHVEWEARHVLATFAGEPLTTWDIPGMEGCGAYMSRLADGGLIASVLVGGALGWEPTEAGRRLVAAPPGRHRDAREERRSRRLRGVLSSACLLALSPFLAVAGALAAARQVARRAVLVRNGRG